jgi:hypothetical protein
MEVEARSNIACLFIPKKPFHHFPNIQIQRTPSNLNYPHAKLAKNRHENA